DDEIPEFDAHEVAQDFGGVASLLIDDGESGNGDSGWTPGPSTVVDLTDSRNPEIVREGKGELL
ncbi:MAG: hypothetical protein K2H57_09960, partial [Duncaniella sp.]|nr:hypothetical protein [Duncaniella sp.]